MVLQTKGIIQLGEEQNIVPPSEDISPIELPQNVPAEEPVLLETVELPGSAYIVPCECDEGNVGFADYGKFEPFPGSVVFTYTGDDVTRVTTTNDFGQIVSDFTYSAGEVSQIDIDKYGESSRRIVFTRVGGNVTQIDITDTT